MPLTQIERDTLNKKELDKLIGLYQKAQRDIVNTFDGATDFGQARRIEQLANIDTILNSLGVASADYINAVLGNQYERGTTDAIDQMIAIKVGIKDSTTMSVIDRQAVASLVSETQEAFAQSLTTVKSSANAALSAATRAAISEQLAQGRILGQSRKEISAAIKARIKTQGIVSLVDRSGTEWTLERYAQMLARTKMTEARNTGLANKMIANGYDLVEVSNHASTHAECAHYEGKILSLTGATKQYPSLADAKANGLFHPNCEHQINAIQTDYAALTKAYDPTSKTYVNQFTNKPIAPPAQPRALKQKTAQPITVKGGSFSGIPVINGRITLEGNRSGKKLSLGVNKVEQRFIQDTTLRITMLRNPLVKRLSRTTRGYYVPDTHSMHIRSLDAATAHTFYHELGHAIDFKLKDGQIMKKADAFAALKKDAVNIVAQRMMLMYANQNRNYTFAQMKALVVHGAIKVDGGTLKLEGKYRKYVSKKEEVFADAYAQYREDKKRFEAYAPNAFNLFEEIIV